MLVRGQRQGLVIQGDALRDEDLGPHQVQPQDGLCDRVLHLDARIDLDEEPLVAVGVEQEFDRARVDVAAGAGQRERGLVQLPSDAVVEIGRRGDLDDLLVAALYGAVALVQVPDVAVSVGEDLDFDVPGPADVALQEDGAVPECPLRFLLRLLDLRRQILGAVHDPQAPAAAAEGRLDHQRESDRRGGGLRGGHVGDRGVVAGDDGDAGLLGQLAGGDLVAERVQDFRRGSHEDDPGVGAGAGHGAVLGQEAVARMDGVDAVLLGLGNDARDVQVGGDGSLAGAHRVGLVGLEAVQAQAVLLGVDRGGAEPQLRRGAHDADGDLAPVGGQQFLHRGTIAARRGSIAPDDPAKRYAGGINGSEVGAVTRSRRSGSRRGAQRCLS